MEQSFKNKIFGILEISSTGNWANKFVNIFLMSLISLNIFAVILETIEPLADKNEKFFYFFEVFSVSVFTIEYLLRLWSCTTHPKYENALTGRIRFAITPLAIIGIVFVIIELTTFTFILIFLGVAGIIVSVTTWSSLTPGISSPD